MVFGACKSTSKSRPPRYGVRRAETAEQRRYTISSCSEYIHSSKRLIEKFICSTSSKKNCQIGASCCASRGLSVRLIIRGTGISRHKPWHFQQANAPHFTQKPHHVCHAQSSIKKQQRAGLCSEQCQRSRFSDVTNAQHAFSLLQFLCFRAVLMTEHVRLQRTVHAYRLRFKAAHVPCVGRIYSFLHHRLVHTTLGYCFSVQHWFSLPSVSSFQYALRGRRRDRLE
jgi:hypothetical protein